MFYEREDRRQLNARAVRRTKIVPAELSDGRSGVMMSIDGNIVCMSAEEVAALCNRLIDTMEASSAVD